MRFVRTLAPAFCASALPLLTACGGAGTLDEVPSDADFCDGGVCEGDGGLAGREVRVDCCDIQTDAQDQLCLQLYTGDMPSGLDIIDVCEGGEIGNNGGSPSETSGGTGNASCEGLSGAELIACNVDSVFNNGGSTGGTTGDTTGGATGFDLGSLFGGGTTGDTTGGTAGGLDIGTLLDLASLFGGGTNTGGGNTGFDLGSLFGGGGTTTGGTGGTTGFDLGSLFGGGGTTTGGDTGGTTAGTFDWGSLFGGGTTGSSTTGGDSDGTTGE